MLPFSYLSPAVQINQSLYDSFRQAFYQHYQSLCQYAFTLVKDTHACEDIVQEMFLRVWDKKQELIGTEELRYYLFTAVRNNCLTHIEKTKKTILTDYSGEEIIAEQTTTIAEKSKEPDFNALVGEALDRLPPKCREVFVMNRLGKLTYQQVADTLGISIKTVENQMGKALKMMRAFIKEKQPYFIGIAVFISFIRLMT
jgi:RNA polymerase sigma-70 factor (family 1)